MAFHYLVGQISILNLRLSVLSHASRDVPITAESCKVINLWLANVPVSRRFWDENQSGFGDEKDASVILGTALLHVGCIVKISRSQTVCDQYLTESF